MTRSKRKFKKAAKEFVHGESHRELGLELNKESEFPEAIWKMADAVGFIGLRIPQEYRGQGLGLFEDINARGVLPDRFNGANLAYANYSSAKEGIVLA